MPGVNTRVWNGCGGRAACAVGHEHGPDLVGAADADVVGHERLEEPAGPAGVVEDDGARHLDLAHGQLPPVPGVPVGGGERGRDDCRPAVEERLDVVGTETVADRLQRARVVTGGEPVGQLSEGDTGPAGLAFGPLVAVEPDLGRVGEVGADLDEPGPELARRGCRSSRCRPGAPSLTKSKLTTPGLVERSSWRREDPLELLGGHDGHHPVAAARFGRVEIGADMVELAVIPTGPIRLLQSAGPGCCLLAAKAFTSRRKRLPIFSITAGDGDRLTRDDR